MKKGRVLIFRIYGNQENQKGNPIGYTRMTRRGKRIKPNAKRYEAWKDYVWKSCQKQNPNPHRFKAGQKVALDCYILYASNVRRPDPGNVVKGIADALADRKMRVCKNGPTIIDQRLYPNDRCVLERAMDYTFSDNPGVSVVISEVN